MQVDDLPSIDPNVDYTQILPIQQKRTIAFINHFVMNTVSFLNKFAQSCESRLMEFEYKLEKVEASLLILESQLASISGLDSDNSDKNENTEKVVQDSSICDDCDLPEVQVEEHEHEQSTVMKQQTEDHRTDDGPPACEDVRFKKFFKMLQFGVPPPAIKLKMQSEGIDPNILDTPNAIIPGYTTINEDNSSETSSNVS